MDSYTYELILNENHIETGKIDIPVNFKDEFNIKFAYWALMDINGQEYKIYIHEKDSGFYEMRGNGKLFKDFKAGKNFKSGERLNITIKPQEPIYYKKSPYSYDNPVRVIDSISHIKEPTGYLCGQSCVAMLVSKPVDEVIDIMNTDKGTHIEHIKAALEYYGIKHEKSLTKYKDGMKLPDICILALQLPTYKHWSIYFDSKYYDPEFGVLDEYTQNEIILRFLKIKSN